MAARFILLAVLAAAWVGLGECINQSENSQGVTQTPTERDFDNLQPQNWPDLTNEDLSPPERQKPQE